MRISRSAKLASAALLTLTGLASGASAAQATPNAVQPLALSSCTGGASYVGTAQQNLSTGVLKVGFCDYSDGSVGTVNIVFQKTSGSEQYLDFGWNWDNSVGGNKKSYWYDKGPFYEDSGQAKTYQWTYGNPGIFAPNSSSPCFQGNLYDENSGIQSYTPTICE